MAPVGMAIAGPVADALGIQSWFVIGGVACVVMAAYGVFSPALMGIEDNHRAQRDATRGAPTGVQADVSA